MMTKTWMKRAIATGLIALMAMVNPLQNLSAGEVGNGGAPSVARAAESDKPYVSEVRLSVDDDADAAKMLLSAAGYEVIDQDLNEDAGSFWNSLGDQAVYMGIKRTDDESKAIRDMKTMNMCGKYSYSDLKNWVENNRQTAREKCEPIFTIRDEFKKSLKSGDYLAEKALEAMNHIKEDDSGMGVGDFLLSDDCGDEGVVKVLVEGNGDLVSSVMQLLYMGCESENDTWLERLSTTTKKSLTKQYTLELYGTDSVIGEKKAEVEKRMQSDLDETAHDILENWDAMRDRLINKDKDEEYTKEEEELLDEDELLAHYMEISDAKDKAVNNKLTEELKKIPYSSKTLLDFFILNKSVFEKDITRLYPMAAAMTEGQKALLKYSSLADLMDIALSRAQTREMGVIDNSKFDEEMNYSDCSLYAGVDRAMFKEGAAMTSRATADFSQSEGNVIGVEYAFYVSVMLTVGAGATTLFLYGMREAANDVFNDFVDKFNNADKELFEDKYLRDYVASKFSIPSDELDETMSLAEYVPDYDEDLLQEKQAMYQRQQDLAMDHLQETQRIARIMLVITVIMTIVSTTLYIISQREKHNREQLAIPTVIVDKDVESTITGYVAYSCVLWNRDRNDGSGRDNRGDLNGDAGDQWLALYTTTDKAMGNPILADSIVAKTGDDGGEKAPASDYVPLTLFGRENAQNLVDENYSYNDKVNGIWMWYKRGATETVLEDDTTDSEVGESDEKEADDKEEGSSPEAETTGSNISGGTMVMGITGGAVGGLVIGLLIGVFFRRKKTIETK